MSKLLIGWAEESLVPDKKVNVYGQFYERISNHVETEITATALAISKGDQNAIIISCDLTAIRQFLLDEVRKIFADICPEVPVQNLIIGATHTHTSVGYSSKRSSGDGFGTAQSVLNEFLPPERQYTPLVTADDSIMKDTDALEFLAERIAKAAKRAWDNRAEGAFTNAFGRAVVGFCRRVCYNDGSAQMWGDTNTATFTHLEGGNDSGIELLYVYNKENKLTGVVANIACPSQILEHRSFISADYWGEVKKNLRKELGDELFLLPMCGAGGDQCPRDLVRWVQPETPINDPNIKRPDVIDRVADPSMFDLSGCRRVGKRVSNEILAVLEELGEPRTDAVFEHQVLTLDLPLRKATISQYDEAVREMEYYIAKNKDKEVFNYEDKARLHVYAGTIVRYREQQYIETKPIEVHIIRLGDIAIATNPFELFLDYGNRMKARARAKQTFIMQLTGGSMGYLPTEKAEQGGHYSAYISSGQFGHEGGDLLTRKTITTINKMFEKGE